LNAFNLLETIPAVHKSGSNSPNLSTAASTSSQVLENDSKLDEKLILASISNATYKNTNLYQDRPESEGNSIEDPLLRSNPIPMRPPRNDFLNIDGSDCDLNWMCLLFVIIALCIIVPLIYIVYIYEHPEFHPQHSPYDDEDKFQHRISNISPKSS
jgi:hypothetical protein